VEATFKVAFLIPNCYSQTVLRKPEFCFHFMTKFPLKHRSGVKLRRGNFMLH